MTAVQDLVASLEDLIKRRLTAFKRQVPDLVTTWGKVTGVNPLRVRLVGDTASVRIRFENTAYTPVVGEKVVLLRVRGQWWPVAPGESSTSDISDRANLWRVIAQTGSSPTSLAARKTADQALALANYECDGTDDQVQIFAAIAGASFDAAFGNGELQVYLTPADYVIQQSITIPDNARVVMFAEDFLFPERDTASAKLLLDNVSITVGSGAELHLRGIELEGTSNSTPMLDVQDGYLSVEHCRAHGLGTVIRSNGTGSVRVANSFVKSTLSGITSPALEINGQFLAVNQVTIESDHDVCAIAGIAAEVQIDRVRANLANVDEARLLSAAYCNGSLRNCRQKSGRALADLAICDDFDVIGNVARLNNLEGDYAVKLTQSTDCTVADNVVHSLTETPLAAIVFLSSDTTHCNAQGNKPGYNAASLLVEDNGVQNILDGESSTTPTDSNNIARYTFSRTGPLVVASSARYPILYGGLYLGMEVTFVTPPTGSPTVEVIYGSPTVPETPIHSVVVPTTLEQYAANQFHLVDADGWFRVQITDAGTGAEDITVDVRQLVVENP